MKWLIYASTILESKDLWALIVFNSKMMKVHPGETPPQKRHGLLPPLYASLYFREEIQ